MARTEVAFIIMDIASEFLITGDAVSVHEGHSLRTCALAISIHFHLGWTAGNALIPLIELISLITDALLLSGLIGGMRRAFFTFIVTISIIVILADAGAIDLEFLELAGIL